VGDRIRERLSCHSIEERRPLDKKKKREKKRCTCSTTPRGEEEGRSSTSFKRGSEESQKTLKFLYRGEKEKSFDIASSGRGDEIFSSLEEGREKPVFRTYARRGKKEIQKKTLYIPKEGEKGLLSTNYPQRKKKKGRGTKGESASAVYPASWRGGEKEKKRSWTQSSPCPLPEKNEKEGFAIFPKSV